jgi:hypothetical protein
MLSLNFFDRPDRAAKASGKLDIDKKELNDNPNFALAATQGHLLLELALLAVSVCRENRKELDQDGLMDMSVALNDICAHLDDFYNFVTNGGGFAAISFAVFVAAFIKTRQIIFWAR